MSSYMRSRSKRGASVSRGRVRIDLDTGTMVVER
jgi:hypothetical protein